MNTPRTQFHINGLKKNPELSGCNRTLEFAKTLEVEIQALQGVTARLCRAVSRRMMPDEPTPEDRMELRDAYITATAMLETAGISPNLPAPSKK